MLARRVPACAARRRETPAAGFSAHVGEPIAADDTQAPENVAGYAVRNPLSLQRLVYLDGQQAVIYKGLKHNPTLGRNFETMDPLEWLARMSDHVPDPGRHRTLFYAYYAHRVRADRAAAEPSQPEVEEKPATRRRCSASWARLISKVFHVDPLTCAKSGGKLAIVAYLHDQVSISRILDHLGLNPPETAKPPPALHEVCACRLTRRAARAREPENGFSTSTGSARSWPAWRLEAEPPAVTLSSASRLEWLQWEPTRTLRRSPRAAASDESDS